MTASTIVTIIVIIILIIFLAVGWHKGFFRMILTTMSLIVTLIVSAFLVTPVTNWLIENTEVEASVEKAVSNALGWGSDSKNSGSGSDSSSEKESNADQASAGDSSSEAESEEGKKSIWEQIKEAAEEMAGDIGLSGNKEQAFGQSGASVTETDRILAKEEAGDLPEEAYGQASGGGIENEVTNRALMVLEENETALVMEVINYGDGSDGSETINYEDYVNEENFSSWEDVEAAFGSGSGQLEQIENEAIDNLSLPSFLKNFLSSNNTAEEYIKLGVSNFQEYIVKSIARLVLKILVYIALVIVILIIIRILLVVTKAISRVPVIHGVNKFFGALLGLLQGLIYLWLACFLISAISQTPFGQQIMDVINGSALLTFIYENNLISTFFKGLFS